MAKTALIELRCGTCDRKLGIATQSQMPVLRRDVAIAHWGHSLTEIPFVAATEDAQAAATTIVSRRQGLFVYNSSEPS